MRDATTKMNGGFVGAIFDHNTIDVGVGEKEHALAQWACHRHVGNDFHGITGEVISYTLSVWVGESGFRDVVQGS